MDRVIHEWMPRNEHTRPLQGQPTYRNAGVIYALDRRGNRYSVGEIVYEQFDEENFQYVLSPYWEVADSLPADIFQGIPGIDMSLRLEKYYRVNYIPVFITERTPSKHREDLWDLLSAVGMDYYDRLEWLIRTPMRSGNDNLIVERRKAAPTTYHVGSRLSGEAWEKIQREAQRGDEIHFRNRQGLMSLPGDILNNLCQMLRIGMEIVLDQENRRIENNEMELLLSILMLSGEQRERENRARQAEGIQRAQREGKYHGGRKKLEIDPETMNSVMRDYELKHIDADNAMRRLGIQTESSFYRRLREYRNRSGEQ